MIVVAQNLRVIQTQRLLRGGRKFRLTGIGAQLDHRCAICTEQTGRNENVSTGMTSVFDRA